MFSPTDRDFKLKCWGQGKSDLIQFPKFIVWKIP
jgi:hypothetical protein